MKKLLLFFIGIYFPTNLFCYCFTKTAKINVTANIYRPISLEKIQDVDFGMIPSGAINVRANKIGKLKIITEEDMSNIRVTWKDEMSSNYTTIAKPIKVLLNSEDNFKKSINSTISAYFSDNSRILNFNGLIEKVPKSALGKYRGTFIVRAEYIN